MQHVLPEASIALRRLLAWQGGLTVILAVLAAFLALSSTLDAVDIPLRLVAMTVALLALTIASLAVVARQREAAISDRHRDMSRRALHDPLTALPNRHYFQLRFDETMERARRSDGRFAVLFIDANDLKAINDSHGHNVGDAALEAIALRITESLRGGDMAARWGGDEFAILADRITERGQAELLAQRISSSVARPLELPSGATLQLSVSIGCALYPADGESAETLFHHADTAMYRAKQAESALVGAEL